MKNVLAVLLITAGAIAALIVTGGGDGDSATATMAGSVPAAVGDVAPRWEYRVVSTRVAPAGTRRETGDRGVRLVAWRAAASPVEADPLAKLERELNRLGGEGWEMCSAAADGTMVFRRAK